VRLLDRASPAHLPHTIVASLTATWQIGVDLGAFSLPMPQGRKDPGTAPAEIHA